MRLAKKRVAAALAVGAAAILGASAPLHACEGHDRHSGNEPGAVISKRTAISPGWMTYRASLQSLPATSLAHPKDEPRKK